MGADSDLGRALARTFAQHGYNITLAARRESDDLRQFQKRLIEEYSIATSIVLFEGTNAASHEAFWNSLSSVPDVLICVYGYLGDEQLARIDSTEARKILDTNYTGPVSLIDGFVRRVKGIKPATIIGISSVAGDRVRASNFHYGSAKARFSKYLDGLRTSFEPAGIYVMTIKPGYIRTKMIAHLSTPDWLTSSPELAAHQIFKAFEKRRSVVYVSPRWRLIMLVIRSIPEFIFKRMKI